LAEFKKPDLEEIFVNGYCFGVESESGFPQSIRIAGSGDEHGLIF